MDTGTIFSVVALVVLVALSAYFSAAETSYSALNRIRVRGLAEGGDRRAALALRLAEDYNSLLSTILVGNNIVNITATSISTVLFVSLLGSVGATVSTVVMTVVILIFGEISPKTLAKESPERFALFAARPLRFFQVVLTPVNWLFGAWKQLLVRLFKPGAGQAITEEELLSMVDEAEQEGAIDTDDRTLIRSVMDFNDSKVAGVLTPRVDIEAVPLDAPRQLVTDTFLQSGYTRLPVYKENLDHIVGVLHLHDYFQALQTAPQGALEEILSPAVYIPPHARISDVMKLMQQKKGHLAVVADEYGGTVGIVTLEDIMEELVGEIWDEHDEVVQQLRPLAGGAYLVAGSADVDDLMRALGLQGQTEATTVNGWIMEQLGRVPAEGDAFCYRGARVAVVRMDGNRVAECRVVPPQE